MGVITESVPCTKEVLRGFTCDKCGAEYTVEDHLDEVSELFHGTHDCGYGSVFEDGTTIEVTLCQHCAKEVLGPYMRVVKREFDLNDVVTPCEVRKAQ